jgi:hypothetical protein
MEQKLNPHVCVPLAAMLEKGKDLCTATCPVVAVAEVGVDMNPCEKILAGMNPVIRPITLTADHQKKLLVCLKRTCTVFSFRY